MRLNSKYINYLGVEFMENQTVAASNDEIRNEQEIKFLKSKQKTILAELKKLKEQTMTGNLIFIIFELVLIYMGYRVFKSFSGSNFDILGWIFLIAILSMSLAVAYYSFLNLANINKTIELSLKPTRIFIYQSILLCLAFPLGLLIKGEIIFALILSVSIAFFIMKLSKKFEIIKSNYDRFYFLKKDLEKNNRKLESFGLPTDNDF